MAADLKLHLSRLSAPADGMLVVLADADLNLGPATRALLEPAGDLVARASRTDNFRAKAFSSVDIIAPAGLTVPRLLVVGLGNGNEAARVDWVKLGGYIMGKLPAGTSGATVMLEGPVGPLEAAQAAEVALGMRLRAYAFERYRTRRKEGEEPPKTADVTLAVGDEQAVKKALRGRDAVAEGVIIARDLVNEPPNVLFPQSFAERAERLADLGVDVEVLDPKAMKKLGMGALLGVAQGSKHDARVVVMRWNGARDHKARPIAFVGKGVTFDTGGISIKPSASMEDMKGDMGGAATVVGLMHALAARKAKANVVGAIGLVENMPDGNAQRPGDIVTSLSGQTIEIINTDAEGRLVLADLLWYVQDRFKPQFMIDLATLTGAILVALAQEYAGLFSNDDALSERLHEAGRHTGEKVWRLPLGPEFDKMIDSKFADMKNTGGRHGGSITAAQFLQRFVNDTPWAHLDIAGTAMGSLASETNRSWGSGWGVRLLDRLVSEHYET
jgi:leucyl aminopeptidase